MTKKTELTQQEKARLMHNYYSREYRRKNKEKYKASVERSLAKKYDEMVARGEIDEQ